jgi:hypothetical protein
MHQWLPWPVLKFLIQTNYSSGNASLAVKIFYQPNKSVAHHECTEDDENCEEGGQ